MIVDALGSFLVFATAFALTGFAAAWASRVAGAGPRLSVAVYTSALAMPPAAAAWLVVASLLPLSWMDEPAVQGAHLASTGAAHLVGELVKGFEAFAYAVLGLVASYLGIYFYLRVIQYMFMSTGPQETHGRPRRLAFAASILCLAPAVVLVFFPGWLLELL